ncbi:hypothetical protein [Methylobacterium oxalidis]|uniref:Uncharacterized protein n=1 Tax=Methylobacterium oxalidis TaxID=944322 RepID=A0A512J976_9HYPH|nr:hypothetical protein [Methylobacterium oxalidis]GEP06521.1 hypothetical protein MOX02_45590 [Methylobacterium oxalidis]GJE30719.1 hypothetical protein LDDCCGHA_0888 [Methylobacterium oxalidis]GLS63901.1 hypothetical protein GCM10007888_22820 [Methylobacterium oxalidis]
MDSSNMPSNGELVQLDHTGSDNSPALRSPRVNPFRRLWEMDYRRFVPIVPPQAELSPHSFIARRPASRGKAVGELGQHGWRGFN